VLPRAETIEYMRENYSQFLSGLAMLDRMYEDLYLGVTYRETERAQPLSSITAVTRSSNCSRSSPNRAANSVANSIKHEVLRVRATHVASENLTRIRKRISNLPKLQQWLFKKVRKYTEFKLER